MARPLRGVGGGAKGLATKKKITFFEAPKKIPCRPVPGSHSSTHPCRQISYKIHLNPMKLSAIYRTDFRRKIIFLNSTKPNTSMIK